jgi:hypothetical protein
MEIKTITKKITDTITYKEVEENVYIAFDGKSFTNQSDCEKYEQDNRAKQIMISVNCIETTAFDIPENWFYIDSEEKLEAFKQTHYYYNKHARIYFNNKRISEYYLQEEMTELNKWYGCIDDSDSDSRYFNVMFFTIDYINESNLQYANFERFID